MELTLQRWSPDKPTRGFWPVKQLPGIVLVRVFGPLKSELNNRWRIACYPPDKHIEQWGAQVWGENWTVDPGLEQLFSSELRTFPTRRAALEALEMETSQKQVSYLKELVA